MVKNNIKDDKFNILRQQAKELLEDRPKARRKSYARHNILKLIEELNIHQIELQLQNEELQVTQAELEETKNRYLDLYEFSPIGYFSLNSNYIIIAVNLTGALLLDLERSKLLNKNFAGFIHSDFHHTFLHHCQQVFMAGSKQICEIQLLKKNEEVFYAQLETILAYDQAENYQQLRMAITDITYRKRVEMQLKESETKFRTIVEASHDWIWCCDLRGYYTYHNPGLENILHYKPRELINKSLLQYLQAKDRDMIQALWPSLIEEERGWVSLIMQYRRRNGAFYYLESTTVPLFDINNKMIGLLGIERDITERTRKEKYLRQHQFELAQAAQKSSLGELTTILAHELNQPLAAIVAFTASCMHKLNSNQYQQHDLIEIMEKVTTQAERAGNILHQLRSFMRGGSLHRELTNINELILEVGKVYNYMFPEKTTVRFMLKKSLPDIKIDKIHIEQVILNLLRNSLEALQDSRVPEHEIIIKTTLLKKKNQIQISIHDNGPGFTGAVLKKMFDPYFTSKPKGIGIGLAICRTIIQAHRGQLWAKSKPGSGACIKFTLPVLMED